MGGAEPASSRGLSHFAPQQIPMSVCHVLAAFQDESPACACSLAQTHSHCCGLTGSIPPARAPPAFPGSCGSCCDLSPTSPTLAGPWMCSGCHPVQSGEQHRHPQNVCDVWKPLSCLVHFANLPWGCTDSPKPWASGMLLPTGLEAKEDSGS